HPLLAVRPGVHPAVGDPDVLSGRSAVRVRPDLVFRARPEGPRADGRDVRPGGDPAVVGACVPVRHRAAWPGPDADRGHMTSSTAPGPTSPGPRATTPSQTVGPF